MTAGSPQHPMDRSCGDRAALHSPPFSEVLAEVTGSRYAYCSDYFVHAAPEGSDVVPCSRLVESGVLDELLGRFSENYRGGDRRAIASMWTMYYFSILTIGAVVAMLEVGRDIPLALQDASICIRRKTGEPHAFLIKHAGRALRQEHATARLYSILRDHAEPLVASIAGGTGISRKLIWTNAASYLSWIVEEVSSGEAYASLPDILLKAPIWPDGGSNPFYNLIRSCVSEDGLPCSRRKICCLRYSLPGCQGCGASCPVPNGRH